MYHWVMKKVKTTSIARTNHKEVSQPIKPVIAGILGAAVGAGIGVIGAAAMRDEKTKAKVMDVMNVVSKKATEYIEDMRAEATHKLTDKAGETGNEVKKLAANSRWSSN